MFADGAHGGGAPGDAPPFQVGLLGHGTVGAAFAELLAERAGDIERFNGRRPVISGVLTRSRGDFEEILAGADLLVEVIGGIEPAREYLLRAMRAGRHVVSANKQLLSQHGEELFECAREHDVRLRFEAAVAGAVPVVRVLEESLSATPIERIHGIVNGTTNFILSEMARGSSYAEALAEAQRIGYAEADPSDDVSGRDAAGEDGDPRAARVRLAGGPRRRPLRGHRAPARRRPRVRARARPRPQARRHGRAPRRRAVGARAPDVPVLGTPPRVDLGAVQRGDGRVRDDHRADAVRPGRRRPPDGERRARRRRQRDDRWRAPARAAAAVEARDGRLQRVSTCTSTSKTSRACSLR